METKVTAISLFSDFYFKKFNFKIVTFKLPQHRHVNESHVQHMSTSLTCLSSVTNSNLCIVEFLVIEYPPQLLCPSVP